MVTAKSVAATIAELSVLLLVSITEPSVQLFLAVLLPL
jgi:hypothetical protein